MDVTQRPAKSTSSIIAKLRRESVRLSQIQDIGGCRIVVSKVSVQNKAVRLVQSLFKNHRTVDRRSRPQHGYRAVHIMVVHDSCIIEVQVRTKLQNGWAQYSEKMSDFYGSDLKYGGGNSLVRARLKGLSDGVAELERLEGEADAEKGQINELLRKRRESKPLSDRERRLLSGYERRRRDIRSTRRSWLKYFKEEAG